MALMIELVETDPSSFEEAVEKPVWLDAMCGAVTRVFFTSSYLTLQVNPGAFCYCKGHLNLRLFVRIMLRSIDLKNTRVNGC